MSNFFPKLAKFDWNESRSSWLRAGNGNTWFLGLYLSPLCRSLGQSLPMISSLQDLGRKSPLAHDLGTWRQRLLQGCHFCNSASQLQLGVISSAWCKRLWNRRPLMYNTPNQPLHHHRNLVTDIRGLRTCPVTFRLLIFVQMYVFYCLRLGTVQCLFKAQKRSHYHSVL